MSPSARPSTTADLPGGSIQLPPRPCRHGEARSVTPWTGEPGTAGTVAVVGAGKMGLPLAAQFAGHGWKVIAVDIDPRVVDSINEGRSHVGEEPGLSELVERAHAAGRLRATADGAEAARTSDVVVLIVPVMLDDEPASRPPLDGLGGRLDRTGRPCRIARDLRDDPARRRYARPLRTSTGGRQRSAGQRDGHGPDLRRLLAGAAVQRGRPRQPGDLPEARRRPRRAIDGSARRRSTRACSTPRSSRCRRPRRPSSRSSPTRRTAT